MPRTSIPRTLTELQTLAESITPEVKANIPQIARSHVKLQGLLEGAKKLLAKRDDYQARKQEATRQARARIRQARMTATLMRKGLTEHYGDDNERLAAFALQPFRGRKRAKKPEGST
jgi:hypothetical protein